MNGEKEIVFRVDEKFGEEKNKIESILKTILKLSFLKPLFEDRQHILKEVELIYEKFENKEQAHTTRYYNNRQSRYSDIILICSMKPTKAQICHELMHELDRITPAFGYSEEEANKNQLIYGKINEVWNMKLKKQEN